MLATCAQDIGNRFLLPLGFKSWGTCVFLTRGRELSEGHRGHASQALKKEVLFSSLCGQTVWSE